MSNCFFTLLRLTRISGSTEFRMTEIYHKKQGFLKPGITRNCNRNFNVITEVLLLTELSEITRKLWKEPELPENNPEITGCIHDV